MKEQVLAENWHSLPERFYHDPRILASELDALFSRSWQFVCHESHIAGDIHPFNLLGQDYFLSRSGCDKLEGFLNRCPHKGHKLVRRAANKALIVCPFHGWRFDLEGNRLPPKKEPLSPDELAQFKLTPLRLSCCAGFVFANISGTAPDVSDEDFCQLALASEAKGDEAIEVPEPRNWKTIMVELLSSPEHQVRLLFPNTVFIRTPAQGRAFVEYLRPEGPQKTLRARIEFQSRAVSTSGRHGKEPGAAMSVQAFQEYYLKWAETEQT